MPRVGAPEGQTRGAARPPVLLRITPPAMDLSHHVAELAVNRVTEMKRLPKMHP